MNPRVILGAGLLFIAAACNKDKFETIPQIEVKSVSTEVVEVGGNVRFTIEFRDKEGDVMDSLFVKKVRLNERVVATNLDSFWVTIPDFPAAEKGEFLVDLNYQTILSALVPPTIPGSNPPQKEPDTLMVKFLALDLEGNKSDTITAGPIYVIRQ